MIDPGRESERCRGTSVVGVLSWVSTAGTEILKDSISVSSSCLDPRRGGGESEVIPAVSSSSAGRERRA